MLKLTWLELVFKPYLPFFLFFCNLTLFPPVFFPSNSSPCPLTLLYSSLYFHCLSNHPPPFAHFFFIALTTDIRYTQGQLAPIHLYSCLQSLISGLIPSSLICFVTHLHQLYCPPWLAPLALSIILYPIVFSSLLFLRVKQGYKAFLLCPECIHL